MSSISRPPPLPGFGLSLSHQPEDDLFPSALDPRLSRYHDGSHRARFPAFTVRELKMLDFMNTVTDKQEWETKVCDESIVEKWKEEMGATEEMSAGNDGDQETEVEGENQGTMFSPEINTTNDTDGNDDNNDDDNSHSPDFTKRMFQHCIDELKYKVDIYKKHGFVQVLSGEIFKSDTAIPSELQSLLKSAVAPLENVPEDERDWHPGSNEQVLDLVHPSLFPLVYSLSRILPDSTTDLGDCIERCGAGEPAVLTSLPSELTGSAYSRRFQWLPCDVDISGDTPRIISYINSLHPQKHRGLYEVIEIVLAKIIPLWNATLSSLLDVVPQRIDYDYVDYHEDAWEKYREDHGPKQEEGEDDTDFEDRQNDWEVDHKKKFYVQPDVKKDFQPPEDDVYSEVDLKRDFSRTGIQIIVKLANILTKPGHRKILALFLVDPNIKIISTANVPCQRQDWREELILDSNVLLRLPVELRDIVAKNRDDFPISLHEAKKIREELMEERRKYVLGYQRETSRTQISLCEH
ncbi:hypothetical protein NP233_g5304 [Leucocoprinus birnbaumii]|uniref:Uncharacterized protein n=1 Tax=Leucocoprinus birnbaumii TaxID=56174 RepID=A0AAD5YR27_9AGAR|nr:hypothetical protein NP233_g5304 [Leucocoprinus birnbaumii]